MTKFERVCQNLGVDAVNVEPSSLTILGPSGFTGVVETSCAQCGFEMEGQFHRCIKCGGDAPRRIGKPQEAP